MKVCMITPTFLPYRGGAEVGIYELSQGLIKLGHTVTLIAPKRRSGLKSREQINGIDVYRFQIGARKYRKYGWILPGLVSFWKFLPKIKPDIVNIHYIVLTGYFSAMVCKTLRIPTVLSLIGGDIYDPVHPVPKARHQPFMKLVMNNVKKITCISSFNMKRAIELGAPPSKIEVVPFGVDVNQFNPKINGDCIREKYGLGNKPIILAVQHISPRKAVEYLIYAIPIVLKNFPETRLLIVDGGRKLGELEDLARKLKVEDKIVFVDSAPRSMLPKYYAAADIFVLHSLFEALGLVLLEAMSSGKPVVTTRTGGTVDVVEDGRTGFLVKPKSPMELARAIGILLKDEKLREKMGSEGRIRAVKYFSWENIAQRMEEIYIKAMQ